MIKSEREYQEALKRLDRDKEVAALQRRALEEANLKPEEVERAMEPLLSFQAQLEEEVQWYRDIRNRKFEAFSNLTDLGRLLIALRIGSNLTQRELADRLGVHESQISRDERNEYFGISVERAQRIAEALGVRIVTRVESNDTSVEEEEAVPV